MIRTLYTRIVALLATVWYGSIVLIAEFFGVRHGQGTIFDSAPRRWARLIARAAGMRVVTHGREAIDTTRSHVYVVNHVSIMDIPAILHAVPDHGFVAKRELSKVPFFGAAARAVGVVYIDRENRKSALAAYEEAAINVREGRSVIVFPEGTRGSNYSLRPFKKGPFVLAIRAGVPIIPVIMHGTIEITPNGSLDVTPGTVNIHLLDPIPTDGLAYDDRDALADLVQARMIEAMAALYHVNATAGVQRVAPPDPGSASPSAISPARRTA